MATDVEHHLGRARQERDLAYRSADAQASDLHMRLSALHLRRALQIQASGAAPWALSVSQEPAGFGLLIQRELQR